ncbi:hypothetical protein E2C01_042903 [Portunus trituberculatus]|uniref:Endonuclease/exonuclease/phosphatase domain-containing protein n=1 Tax=Portunus trituberculatus TaxID=210409 RepID=A0A5B7FUV4_PORTR|nr:hypothetical protein [Portunus trituberculatus]
MQWNIQGPKRKHHLLQEAAKGDLVDVFLLQETLVTENRPLKLKGYICYNTPVVAGGAQGCSILVNSRIPSTLVPDPAFCGEGVEFMAVTLTLQNISLHVYNIYKSRDCRLNLEEVFEQASITPTFIGGDFNCHHPILHSPQTPNRDGRHLATAILQAPGVQLLNSEEPTHKHGGVLDLSFISTTLHPITSWKLHHHLRRKSRQASSSTSTANQMEYGKSKLGQIREAPADQPLPSGTTTT